MAAARDPLPGAARLPPDASPYRAGLPYRAARKEARKEARQKARKEARQEARSGGIGRLSRLSGSAGRAALRAELDRTDR